VRSLKRVETDLIVRPADADIIPPLSDYQAFWEQRIPFLFLSAGRSRVYHTPEDTPDRLDYPKIAATARWLTRFVRVSRTRELAGFVDQGLHAGTLDEVGELVRSLVDYSTEAATAALYVAELRRACDRRGNLPEADQHKLGMLVGMLESRLS
jgi:hypothetical protein